VVGQSLGGLLALHLAATVGDQVSAVAALATPLPLGPLAMTVIKLAQSPMARHVPRIPKMGGSDVRSPDARRDNPAYAAIPTPSLIQMGEAMRVVDGELALVTAPLLIVHARHDHTAPVASAERIAGGTRSRQLRTRILERSFHLITIDVEREIVAAEVGTFFARAARA
jgi:carboxylesterase